MQARYLVLVLLMKNGYRRPPISSTNSRMSVNVPTLEVSYDYEPMHKILIIGVSSSGCPKENPNKSVYDYGVISRIVTQVVRVGSAHR